MRRFHVAWVATELLLVAGVVVSLAKGIDYEEAAIMAVVAALLLPFRSSFYRMSGFSELRLSPAWFAMVLAGVVAATWLGFFSYRHVEYSNQLWWEFAVERQRAALPARDRRRLRRARLGGRGVPHPSAADRAVPARPGERRRAPPRRGRPADAAERRAARRQEVPDRGGRERLPDVRPLGPQLDLHGRSGGRRAGGGRAHLAAARACRPQRRAHDLLRGLAEPTCRRSSTWGFRS